MSSINLKRVRQINEGEQKKGPLLYWMSRDQRIKDNWALLFAQMKAKEHKEPLIVIFSLLDKFKNSIWRAYRFMLMGLEELKENLKKLNIGFILKYGNPGSTIPKIIEEFNISILISDFSPLRIKQKWNKQISNRISIPFYEVDTHNIIPVWTASQKKEYAAYTLRKKIKSSLYEFLDDFPRIKSHPYALSQNLPLAEVKDAYNHISTEESTNSNLSFKSGETNAFKVLNDFLKKGLTEYSKKRNNPNLMGTSNLSPYLHFGQISSQRVVLEARKTKPINQLKNTFYDEIIVRKELSDNFCYYEANYDSVEGFHSWAQETLNQHINDKREYIYSRKEFENAKTHDDAWNAAQLQMVQTGKMHGYMRMYWGKKILEWTETPEKALKIAIYLNDKFELDGRDPNGYTGIAWSIGGVHDRAWKERNIYGKIRYMSYKGLERKF
ncbi:MAG: deoxyribodipyrimidine photo-lyase, partial [Candidatus Lokiarchaeota archaeon]|nr:deoxyribodipyrimidine photo-lyase [Candidatus Lokiarchaeota archaeon]MBD3202255.1 deoxyribodipyrimidine photo-lyase [Candidatus Lokiarchaeota archaeon]